MNKHLQEMESLVDELVANAEKLKEISHQILSKDELKPLQQKQEEILKKLQALEKKLPKEIKEAPMQELLGKKLERFEKLNASFIANLQTAHELIRFNQTS